MEVEATLSPFLISYLFPVGHPSQSCRPICTGEDGKEVRIGGSMAYVKRSSWKKMADVFPRTGPTLQQSRGFQ
jgi:hypothetical protein